MFIVIHQGFVKISKSFVHEQKVLEIDQQATKTNFEVLQYSTVVHM